MERMEDIPNGPTEHDIDQEIDAEVDRVKRRRSTVGRGRSVGGRLSLCAAPAALALALDDQIMNIDENLPWASKLLLLVDISIREAMRRLQARLPEDECVTELRVPILTQSKSMAEQAAEDLSCLPLVPEDTLQQNPTARPRISVESYKKKTDKLKEEYKNWKGLRTQRERECRAAEVEFNEAKSGVTVLDEDQTKHFTSRQRSLLASSPNYRQYLEETVQAREKTQLILEEVKHASNAITSLLAISRRQAESSFATLENLFIGDLRSQSMTTILNNNLQQNIANSSAMETL